MKWGVKEVEEAIELLLCGNSFELIGEKLNRSKKSIKEKLNKLGYKQSDYFVKNYNVDKKCGYCGNIFTSLITENRTFCSQSCGASFNNSKFIKRITEKEKYSHCLNCGVKKKNNFSKGCSKTCGSKLVINKNFKLIESGDTTLTNLQYKKYLIHIHGEKCMECGWCSINPKSNKIPIELEHIDGHSGNNSLDNLKLLCPNCHSLTPTYKALNKGNGRHSRMLRYNDGKSY